MITHVTAHFMDSRNVIILHAEFDPMIPVCQLKVYFGS